jgi:mono/diheme cytochrome c family protein
VNSNVNSPAATPPDELASAREIYSAKCINCHKEDGTGGITDIEGKKIKAPNFKSERMRKDSDEDWIKVIENGEKEDGMPAFKGLISDTDIKNLVKLIRRDFQGK